MLKQKRRKNLILRRGLSIGLALSLAISLLFSNTALAEICPSNTTVAGTTVVFVGELTDMGGDGSSSVWFEYGQTTSFGQSTIQKTLTQPEMYCITVSGLLPSTTYYYRAIARNSAGTSYGETKSFTTTPTPSVNLKANGSDGPITISYNSPVTLTWIASNVDYCQASGDWSGNKGLSGSESIGNLTSSKTYTLSCSGPRGSASDSVTVNVGSSASGKLSIRKTIRNLSRGTDFIDSVEANPGDALVIGIVVKAKDSSLTNVIVRDTLPGGLIYRDELRVNNILTSGDILNIGLNIGTLSAGEEKTITFRADVAGPENFSYGRTELTNVVYVSSNEDSRSDTAKIFVSKTGVAGAATSISTGLTDNLLLDFFLIPFFLSTIAVWLFKPKFLFAEEWLDGRKRGYQEFKSKKILQSKIAQIRAKEFFKK